MISKMTSCLLKNQVARDIEVFLLCPRIRYMYCETACTVMCGWSSIELQYPSICANRQVSTVGKLCSSSGVVLFAKATNGNTCGLATLMREWAWLPSASLVNTTRPSLIDGHVSQWAITLRRRFGYYQRRRCLRNMLTIWCAVGAMVSNT